MANILINGKMTQWNNTTIDYGQAVDLAFPLMTGEFTVTYSRAKSFPQMGTLTSESTEEITVQDGTSFNVVGIFR